MKYNKSLVDHHNSSSVLLSTSNWSTMARKRTTRLTLFLFLLLSLIAFGVFVPVFALLPSLSQSQNDQQHHPTTKSVSLLLLYFILWKLWNSLQMEIEYKWSSGFWLWVSLVLFQFIYRSKALSFDRYLGSFGVWFLGFDLWPHCIVNDIEFGWECW